MIRKNVHAIKLGERNKVTLHLWSNSNFKQPWRNALKNLIWLFLHNKTTIFFLTVSFGTRGGTLFFIGKQIILSGFTLPESTLKCLAVIKQLTQHEPIDVGTHTCIYTCTYSKEERLEETHQNINRDQAGIAVILILPSFTFISKNFYNK